MSDEPAQPRGVRALAQVFLVVDFDPERIEAEINVKTWVPENASPQEAQLLVLENAILGIREKRKQELREIEEAAQG